MFTQPHGKMPPRALHCSNFIAFFLRRSRLVLLACFLLFSFTAAAQKVNLSFKQVPLAKVLDEISRQSGTSIIYNEAVIKRAGNVSVEAKGFTVQEAVSLALKGLPLKFQMDGGRLYIKQVTTDSPLTNDKTNQKSAIIIAVHGKVKSEKGEPVPGATIQVKGSGKYVVTDDKGLYEIRDIQDNAILVISSVGFQTQEIAVSGDNQVNVTMKVKISQLEETVVTAFGVEKSSKEIGYSTATVKGDELTKGNSGNLLTGLSARVSGLSISTQSADMTPQMQVLMRGIRSFSSTSNNQPLFILNGSPLSFGSDQNSAQLILDFINNINPVDIDKVTILKGANATALYGPDGVNGVIIITTKKGIKGKPAINFRSSYSVQQIDYRSDKYQQHEYGSGTGLVDAAGNGIYSGTINNGWGPRYDGSLVQLGHTDENGNKQMVPYSYQTDYRKFFNAATTQQNNLSISQGDEISNLYLGFAYNDQTGVLPGDKRNTLNAFVSGGRKIGIFNVNYQVNYSRELANLGPESFGPNGPSFIPFLKYKDYTNYEWADNNHYWSDADIMSPYQAIASDRTYRTNNSTIFNFNISANPLSWLTINEVPGAVLSNIYERHTIAPVYFSDWAKQNGGFFRAFDREATLNEQNATNTTLHNHFTMTAVNKSGDFDFRNMVGNVVDEQRYKLVTGTSNGLSIPVYNLAFSTDVPYAGEQYILTRRFSYFATSTTGYKQRVFLELTARNDWDSKQAAVARGKDLYFGGNVSVLMKDVFPSLKQLPWLSFLQLRGAVTSTANMDILPYQSERTLQAASYLGFPYDNSASGGSGLASYSYIPGNPNPNLKPEKVLSVEGGFNARFFQDKIGLNFAYYWQRNNGVITTSTAGWMSGAPTIDNLGVMDNWGYEVDINLNSIVKHENGFNMSAGFHIAYNDNVIKSLPADYGGVYVISQPGGANGLVGTVARVGHEAFEYWVYDFEKSPSGKTIIDPTTGYPIPDLNKAVYTGNTTPKFVGGLTLNFTYKKFSLSNLGEFSLGGEHYFSRGAALTQGGLSVQTTYNNRQSYVYPNSVYQDANGNYVNNTNIKTQDANSLLYANVAQASINYLSSASFLKLKETVLSYETNLKTKTIKKLNIGIYGRNLFNWYAKNNIYGDPQFIKGPGRFDGTGASQSGGGGATGNSAPQAGADQFTPSGIVEYGVILSASF